MSTFFSMALRAPFNAQLGDSMLVELSIESRVSMILGK